LIEAILALQQAAFPRTPEFKHQRCYKTPLIIDDQWFLAEDSGRLIASIRLIHRTISTLQDPLAIGGVANTCSHPKAWGTGAVKTCMRAAQSYLTTSPSIDCGMLFCNDIARGFYEKLGWHRITNPVNLTGPDSLPKRVTSTEATITMIHPGRKEVSQWPSGDIDLNGPEW
jgi:predicted GNAT family N-acyltransferase